MKLSQEQSEALTDLLQNTNGMRALLIRIEQIVAHIEQQVLTLPLTPDTEGELVHRKARAEGARKVSNDLRALLKLPK